MPWIVYFIAGGGTFLPGAGMLALAVAARVVFDWRRIGVLSIAAVVIGIALITISGEAITWWVYWVWVASIVAWLLRGMPRSVRAKRVIDLTALTSTCLAAAIAIVYRQAPSLPPAAFSRLYVIGDSISAGIGRAGSETWPGTIASEHGVTVINLARAGSTIADATRHLEPGSLSEGLVLLEIGGNDAIGRVKADQFGRDLEQLAGRVCGPGRAVVMLELPLFPFDNGYGLQQRRVASRHGIHLIPRKNFVKVIGARGATSDGIHLTAEGQRRMAEMVWGLVGASLRASKS
ncbi:MAG TPA: GDSL-type esterase/lipase family protein [Tepidisphaeraceae bacterium]|jgi:lysophospholipase L1-like esterase